MAKKECRTFKGDERNVKALCDSIMDSLSLKIIKFKVKSLVAVTMVDDRWGIKFFLIKLKELVNSSLVNG